IQGAGCELGFAIFRYRRFDLVSMSLSAVFAATFIFAFELYYLQYILLSPLLLLAQLIVRYASAIVFSGVISKRVCDGLVATGTLKAFPLGARQKPMVVLAD
ncbi:MAG TPA: ECF transporter S component, partial [Thermomicrobiales bacterium]|nr:ECF transporter S component [Thermomicrobiales bacterium]